MGVVLRARDPELRRDVAVKVVSGPVLLEPGTVERFQREAQVLARLSHPNIVRIFDWGEEQGRLYYVMELLPGTSLDRRRPEETQVGVPRPPPPFDAREFLDVFTPLADALHEVHAVGVVHRDIKPGNVMTGVPERGAVLTDFGLTLVSGSERLTRTGFVVGTGRYLAPEQLGEKPPGPLADIYSLGVTMFEVVTGRIPFEELHGPELLVARMCARLPAVDSLAPEVPPEVAAVIDRCVEFEPGRRFRSARELHRALVAAVRTTARRPSAPVAAAVGPGRAHKRRRSWKLAAAVSLILWLGVVLAFRSGRFRAAVAPVAPPPLAAQRPATVPPRAPVRPPPDGTLSAEFAYRGLRTSGDGESCVRHGSAAMGERVLVAWSRPDRRLGVALWDGARWSRPPADGTLEVESTAEPALAARGARFHLLFTRRREGIPWLHAATTDPDAGSWSPVRPLAPAPEDGVTTVIAAAAPGDARAPLLAVWEGEAGKPLHVAWGNPASRGPDWTVQEGPLPTATLGRVTALLPPGKRPMVIWQQDDPARKTRDLFFSRSPGADTPWSPTKRQCMISPGFDRVYPTALVAGGLLVMQFSESQLPAYPMVLAHSIDGGECFSVVGRCSYPYGKDSRSVFTALGKRLWAAWTLPGPNRIVWSTSPDLGRSWALPSELAELPDHHPGPLLEALPGGYAWLLWVSPARDVRAVRLP